jgi:hypothetical protein
VHCNPFGKERHQQTDKKRSGDVDNKGAQRKAPSISCREQVCDKISGECSRTTSRQDTKIFCQLLLSKKAKAPAFQQELSGSAFADPVLVNSITLGCRLPVANQISSIDGRKLFYALNASRWEGDGRSLT